MSRPVAFSGKKKKEQLKDKRNRKAEQERFGDNGMSLLGRSTGDAKTLKFHNLKNNGGGDGGGDGASIGASNAAKRDRERYRLLFQKDIDIPTEIANAKKPLKVFTDEEYQQEMCLHLENLHLPESEQAPFPVRPHWSYGLSKEALEAKESEYFQDWVARLDSTYGESLGYYEHNLESWRQLWRTLEFSDVLLLLADARYPTLHFPPGLYRYITQTLQKSLVLVLNKVDLVSLDCLNAYKAYFHSKFPELFITEFTSFPKAQASDDPADDEIANSTHANNSTSSNKPVINDDIIVLPANNLANKKLHLNSKKRGKKRPAWGVEELIKACHECTIHRNNKSYKFSDWLNIRSSTKTASTGKVEPGVISNPSLTLESPTNVATIGAIGCPNSGKSTLLNGVLGKKFASTSRTPGHTKHFQTIYLTSDVRLCDSPGIVFPSFADRFLQLLSGVYPIAQIRNPYSIVGYLAQRIDLVNMLKIVHPATEYDPHKTHTWTAWDICDGWANKMGFQTAKAGRPDTYRGANHILRLCLDGKLPFCFYPPDYTHLTTERTTIPKRFTIEDPSLLANESHTEEDLDSEPEQLDPKVVCTNAFAALDLMDMDY